MDDLSDVLYKRKCNMHHLFVKEIKLLCYTISNQQQLNLCSIMFISVSISVLALRLRNFLFSVFFLRLNWPLKGSFFTSVSTSHLFGFESECIVYTFSADPIKITHQKKDTDVLLLLLKAVVRIVTLDLKC